MIMAGGLDSRCSIIVQSQYLGSHLASGKPSRDSYLLLGTDDCKFYIVGPFHMEATVQQPAAAKIPNQP